MEHQPVVKKTRGISPVWILPIVAAAICGWLLYKSYSEAGIDIEVQFYDASGIVPGKTQVMSMGIPLGVVKDMEPDFGTRIVTVKITMERSTERYLVEDLKFWLVKPEVSARRITGLDTILSGSYIGVQKGESTIPARSFTALRQAPPIRNDAPGLHITLTSKSLRSIQEGSSIYFQNIPIGEVKTYELQEDESVAIKCFILPEYSHLIRSGSRFYDASGLLVSGTLPNLKLRMESISSLFIGGIVVGTPDALKDSPPAESGDTFSLYESFDDADYGIPMTLKLASGSDIIEGSTKVIYRGVEAGRVKEISISDDDQSVTAHIMLDPQAEKILRENTRFWLVKPEISIDGVRNLGTLLSGTHITFKPGDGEFRNDFEIMPEAPLHMPLRPGTSFRLTSADTPASTAGSPVYYKKMKIGELLGSELNPDYQSVTTSIYIYDEYTEIVKSNAVFIESGGISIKANLSGFSFEMDPLVKTFKGGIDLIIPGGKGTDRSEVAGENHLFTLYRDIKEATEDMPALLPDGLYLKLASEDLGSYRTGTPVFFKKIKVGQIIDYDYSKKTGQVELTCFIEKRYRDLVTSTSKFYNASGIRFEGSLSGISVETESLESIVLGGISVVTDPGGAPVKNDQRFEIYRSLEDAQQSDQVDVSVQFENIGQLKNGAKVSCRGVTIGHVAQTSFDEDLRTIRATLKIEKQYENFFRKDTKIWLTKPSVKLSKMEHIDSLLFGLSVVVEPGSGILAREFVGLNNPPHPFFTSFKGLGLVLETNQLNSLDVGSPVYYRRVKVGEVAGYDLAFNFKDVLVYIIIEDRYAALIRENTKFWNASGVTVTGGVFSGISVSTESLEALVAGGISLATPGKENMGSRVDTGYRFTLHDKPEAGWLDWSPEIFVIEEEKPTDLH